MTKHMPSDPGPRWGWLGPATAGNPKKNIWRLSIVDLPLGCGLRVHHPVGREGWTMRSFLKSLVTNAKDALMAGTSSEVI